MSLKALFKRLEDNRNKKLFLLLAFLCFIAYSFFLYVIASGIKVILDPLGFNINVEYLITTLALTFLKPSLKVVFEYEEEFLSYTFYIGLIFTVFFILISYFL